MHGCSITLNLKGEVKHFKEKPGPTNKLIHQQHDTRQKLSGNTHTMSFFCTRLVTDSPALARVAECSTLLMKVNVYISHVSSGW
jgi:hypothetical protein